MTADVRHLAQLLLNKGYHVTPLEFKSKAATLRDWQHTLIDKDSFETYFPPNKSYGLGLLLGTEVADGVYLVAFDIDLEDDLLISRVRMAVGPNGIRKKGKKGVTVIARAAESFPKKVYKRKMEDGKKAIAVELLGARIQTVLPPSIHPETGEPYEWLGRPLQDVDPLELPLITKWTIDEIALAAAAPESQYFNINDMTWNGPGGGGTVDDSLLHATAVLVQRGWDDEAIIARVNRAVAICLHKNKNARKWDEKEYLKRLGNLIEDARRKGYAEKKGRPPQRGERRIAIVEAVIAKLGSLERLWRDATVLRQYNEGHWPALDVDDLTHEAINMDTSWMEASDAEAVVRTVTMRSPARKRPVNKPRICVQNGTLDVMSGELLEWNAGDLLTSQLPFSYDDKAKCSAYDDFIINMFTWNNKGERRSDEQVRRHVETFEEYLGLTLVEDLSFEMAMVMRGPPASGKSTALRIFRLLQDPRAISTVSLHKMHEERYTTSMVGKLVNLSGEIPSGVYIEEEFFKKVISGDGVAVRKLFEEVKNDVILQVRIVAGMNELFHVRDASGAVERRLLILDTRHGLREDQRERGLYDNKIAPDAPGILNRAVQGLQRLYRRGHFDPPEDHTKAKRLFSEESNHIISWLQDRTHQGQMLLNVEYELPKDLKPVLSTDLYSDYAEWAKQNGHKQLSVITWGTRLGMMNFPVEFVRVAGKSYRVRHINLLEEGRKF